MSLKRARGSASGVAHIADDLNLKREVLQQYEKEKYAASTLKSRDSVWGTWIRMHYIFFGDTQPVLPLTVDKIAGVASVFKRGNTPHTATMLIELSPNISSLLHNTECPGRRI